MTDQKFNMRPLMTADIFKMSKILKKMDLKLKFENKASQEEVGVMLIQKILENLYLAEEEVNSLLAGLLGITTEEFSELPIQDTIEVFNQFKDQKGIINFLKLAGK